MAKIKLKLGDNEIEIESRDFYVDNQTIDEVIESVSKHIFKAKARIVSSESAEKREVKNTTHLSPQKAEIEKLPEITKEEYASQTLVTPGEIVSKIHFLIRENFFDQARTVPETMAELREHGWVASSIDVSKILVKMAFNRQIIMNSRDHRNYFFVKEALLVN